MAPEKRAPWLGTLVYSLFVFGGGLLLGSYWMFRSMQREEGMTILYEPQGTMDSTILGALGNILFGPVGGAVGEELGKETGPRWIIPVKVQPQTLGDAQGLSYLWVSTRWDAPRAISAQSVSDTLAGRHRSATGAMRPPS